MKIGLIISSVDSNYLANYPLLEICDLFDEHVIVNQGKKLKSQKIYKLNKIFDNNKGLSKSRNIGIDYLKNKVDIIVIADDDVEPIKGFKFQLEKLRNLYRKTPKSCLLLKAKDLQNKFRKRYNSEGLLRKKQLIAVSSIDITFSTMCLNYKDSYFREDLGLGAKYPACEDSYFVHKLFSENIPIYQSNISLWRHDVTSTGIKLNLADLYARWLLFSKFYSLPRSVYLLWLIFMKGLIINVINLIKLL